MEETQSRERYHEPRTVYSFAFAGTTSVKSTLILASGRHAAAFVLSHVAAAPVTLKVTARQGEHTSTWDCASCYETADHWVAVMGHKPCDDFAYPMVEFLLTTFSPSKVLALDSLLLGDYVGEPGNYVKYLSNPQGLSSVQDPLAPGNVLRGVSAASVLIGEIRGLPSMAIVILASDHVLSSSTCRLYELAPLLTPIVTAKDGYAKGIAAVEREVYSHNIYS